MEALDFLNISFIDIIDIVIVGLLIFFVLRWLRGSSAMSIFLVIITFFVAFVIADALSMKLTTAILQQVLNVGLLALIVIFQPEVRRFMTGIGSRYKHSQRITRLLQIFSPRQNGSSNSTLSAEAIDEICNAVHEMSADKTGVLLVLRHTNSLEDIEETGDRFDAEINKMLLKNLFFKNSPLHDGAVIIDGNKVVAARCTLPMTSKTDLPAHYGMRHKAGLGITEQSDVDVILVSEETGNISFARAGQIKTVNLRELKALLWNNKSGEPLLND